MPEPPHGTPGQAAGPPRQATGPSRSGAGVGVGMLRGYHDVSLAISKIQKFNRKGNQLAESNVN